MLNNKQLELSILDTWKRGVVPGQWLHYRDVVGASRPLGKGLGEPEGMLEGPGRSYSLGLGKGLFG